MNKQLGTAILATAFLTLSPAAAFADSSSGSGSVSEQSSPSLEKILNSSDAQQEKATQVAPDQLDAIKAKAAERIAKRQRDLTSWSAKLATAPADCGQNGASLQRIATTQAALAALSTSIQTSTTKEAAKPLYLQIFTHQRVYLVGSPAVHIALACDQQAARAAKQLAEVAELQAKITAPVPSTVAPSTVAGATVPTNAPNTAAAAALLAQVTPLIELGKATSAAASASLVSLTADQGNESVKSGNAVKVATAREQIRQADANLDRAGELLKQTRQALSPVVKSAKQEQKKTASDAAKAKRDADREAAKVKRDAEKAKDKAERENKKNDRKSKKDDKRDDKDDDD
jgi:hypothetical protein